MRRAEKLLSKRNGAAAMGLCGLLSLGASHAADTACAHSGREIEQFIESSLVSDNAETRALISRKLDAIHGCLARQNAVCIVGSWGSDPASWEAQNIHQALHADHPDENPDVEIGVIDFIGAHHRRLCLIGQPSFGSSGLWIMEAWLWEGGVLRQTYFGPFARGDGLNAGEFRDQMIRQAATIRE